MKIENSFEVPVPLSEAWALLMDIEKVIGCLPGAELSEIVDDDTYKGSFSVRLGPVAVKLNGTARFEERDESTYTGRVKGQATDAKGRGGANSDITFALEPANGGCRVRINTDVQLSGALAQFGRGAGMIANLASQIIEQFAACLRERLTESADRAPGDAHPSPPSDTPSQPMEVGLMGLRAIVGAILDWFKGVFGRNA